VTVNEFPRYLVRIKLRWALFHLAVGSHGVLRGPRASFAVAYPSPRRATITSEGTPGWILVKLLSVAWVLPGAGAVGAFSSPARRLSLTR
jgi:hypothetical protein